MTKPGACNELEFAKTEAEFEADAAAYNEAREAAGGELAGHLRGARDGDEAARGPRASGRALALAGDARTPPSPRSASASNGPTRRSTSPPTGSSPSCGEWRRRGFVGANVTVPHKGAALALADRLSETAREIGAANTLSFGDDGIRADNTDADGLLAALPPPRPAAARCCSAPAAPRARSSGACSARAPRSRSGTGPRSGPGTSARSWVAARSRSPTPARTS